MSILARLKPGFWDHGDTGEERFKHLFNFRRIWKLTVVLTTVVALSPVISMAVFDYNVTHDAMESEIVLRTSRLVSNARRTVSFFLTERKAALDFIVHHHPFKELNDPVVLTQLLDALQKAFTGFTDLGVIDASGRQQTYVGPFELTGKDYSGQEWFEEVLARGVYISDVFLGYRQLPHLVIAVRHELEDGSFYVLRATVDTKRFNDLLSGLEVDGGGDAFIVNQQGTIQTPTRWHGKVLKKMLLSVPEYSPKTEVLQCQGLGGDSLVVGYAYIAETPFILMIIKHQELLMKPWHKTRKALFAFLVISITAVLVVILRVATYLVNKIHDADEKRVVTLHHMEYSERMASIGRLAAGVAHEINNPLAIINEKAGLIHDTFTLKQEYAGDEKLIGLVESVQSSVERCGAVTRRLLSFARHMDVDIQPVKFKELIEEVLGFIGKEAEYRGIQVNVAIRNEIPTIESDRGKLQQIFLNLVNNAFAAMNDGGHLDIKAYRRSEVSVSVEVNDDGCGIPEADLKRIFEPFFSTKKTKGGTGLGLSITYGLVRELGGDMRVKSEVGKGTSFTVTLPLQAKQRKRVDT
ncbi:MAG: ATP-binding protein [Thermodesulfobacteriota bacterium]|nr:ATP-binding protein [Thermodesulfobacteriota bacterium]